MAERETIDKLIEQAELEIRNDPVQVYWSPRKKLKILISNSTVSTESGISQWGRGKYIEFKPHGGMGRYETKDKRMIDIIESLPKFKNGQIFKDTQGQRVSQKVLSMVQDEVLNVMGRRVKKRVKADEAAEES